VLDCCKPIYLLRPSDMILVFLIPLDVAYLMEKLFSRGPTTSKYINAWRFARLCLPMKQCYNLQAAIFSVQVIYIMFNMSKAHLSEPALSCLTIFSFTLFASSTILVSTAV
jgi:hypothetical protein